MTMKDTITNSVIFKLECKKCGYEWYPRAVAMPKKCPECQSRNYNKEKRKG